MSGTCAACMQPMVSGERFVVSGTEILHQTCAAAGRMTELHRVRQEAHRVHAEVRRMERELEQARSSARFAEERCERALGRVHAMQEGRVRAMQEADRIHAELETVRAEAESLRVINASLRAAMARLTSPATTQPAESRTSPEEQDGTRVRFSLLEFD